ncbi:MAG: hypothetical protein ACI32N_07555 [Bulleidia sp.]
MEDLQEKLIRAIDEDVRSNADLVEEVLNREKDILLNDQINFFREGLEKDKAAYLEGELKELRTYAATKSSRDRLDVKKKLMELRTGYTEQLFDDVRKQVLEFSHSPQYTDYIAKALKEISVSAGGYFEVRKEDVSDFAKLLKQNGYDNPVEAVHMPLGGFRYIDSAQRMQYSCSLDERCEEQFAWFTANSSFRIMEREDKHE